jgi:Ca2+-binding RTX toxin-like protein
MASIPGGQYNAFAQGGQQVNVVMTTDGQNLPPPILGEFNLEVITGGVVPPGLPPGYQGVAVLSDNGKTIDMAYGNWSLQMTGDPTVKGGAGHDTIYAGNAPTSIIGGLGPDLIYGGSGPDTIQGGFGRDTIYGGTGNDTITGGRGPDTIYGGSGQNVITGGSGPDLIYGGDGQNTITGGAGPDTIFAGQNGDLITGGNGPDLIYGGDGPDTIYGGAGPDTINGGDGGTLIHGGVGADQIFLGSGQNTVFGGSGPDTIDGGSGSNQITAGTGGTLIQDSGATGHDTVVGFNQAHGDAITFAGQDAATVNHVVATASVSGGSTTITLPDGSTMTLVGITHIDSTFFH